MVMVIIYLYILYLTQMKAVNKIIKDIKIATTYWRLAMIGIHYIVQYSPIYVYYAWKETEAHSWGTL